jgi:hypothetical protein
MSGVCILYRLFYEFAGIQHEKYEKHGYFFSWENKVTKNLTVAWLTGRNICRRHCMDLVSLETAEENAFIKVIVCQ